MKKIIHANNIDYLRTLKDNSVDSVVTDPPYGINFMNKKWDYDVPSVELWQEVFRVLKPGGHMLVACGTRTQHRMAVNIEDAGFEIRDIVAWVYGSGFPKSMDVSKAIESKLINGNSNKKSFSKLDGERLERGNWGITKNSKEYGFRDKDYTHETDQIDRLGKLEATTDEAKQWQGWGTALKPSMELWTLARKPLNSTVAQNILEYGVGGLNIDATRIPLQENESTWANEKGGDYENVLEGFQRKNKSMFANKAPSSGSDLGRYPANFIHDGSEEVESLFPNTESGLMTSNHKRTTDRSPNGIYGKFDVNYPLGETYGDSGSASRFFYVAKASQEERNFGLYDFDEKRHADRNKDDGVDGDNPRNRSNKPKKNFHPTVKPIELMRYLVRMITPPNGICLDPYLGSGTTAIACEMEKFNYMGIELDPQYIEIAKARVAAVKDYEVSVDTKTAIKESIKEDKEKELGIQNIFDLIGE